MEADYSSGDQRPARRKREADGGGYDSERKRRHHEDSNRRRHRERSRSRRRERSARSRTPDSSSRRAQDDDRERDRDRERERRHRRRSRSAGDRSSRRDRDKYDDRDDGHKERRRRREHDGERRKHRSKGTSDNGASDDDRVDTKSSLVKRSGPLPSQDASFAVSRGEEPEKPKEQPNFGNTGLLAAASNQVTQDDGSTITLKYHEPPEARKPPPRDQWKLFVFKGADILDTVDLSNRSCWLFGREAAVVDLQTEHPSISKQHAVIQFRYIEKRNEFGDKIGKVKPYLIDLESSNGTMLNKEKAPDSRYLELRDKDMIQFGQSTREYVLMLAPK